MPTFFLWKPVLLASLIVSIGQFSMGLVFPSLPWIAQDFAISSDEAQLLISVYLLGFGPSQLIYGPISDALGRKPILIAGLTLALLGLSLTVTASHSFDMLVIGRFIQGLGAGCCAVLARASLRDSYDGPNLPRALSWVTIVASFTPIIAPVLGGFINHSFGWLAVFIALLSYIAIVLLLLIFLFSETLPKKKPLPNVRAMLRTYKSLIKSRYFCSFASIGWFNFSLIVVSISVMPFIMQIQIGMTSDQYALWALIPACGLLVGGTICNRIRPIIGTKKMLFCVPAIHLSAGLWLICAPLTPIAMMFGQFLLTLGNGIAFPCAQTQLLVPYKEKAGSVAALSGAGQMTFSALFSMFLMSLGIQEAWHLGLVIGFLASLSAVSMWFGFKSQPV
ncbi:multidrug effflux MFS transporter [Vibrio sp. DW001]|uniref:multidrug effflux MFS transporter n=1 Tax=Vibrio sp. DW001 TaxID=2912315 RepID=UPI0023B11D23|nr:multidrug effflux MFS transporter [Vibrio sp. DW001]WED27470.1 multidrug effflux MFS transporter [Vibrio sp. DW001]